MSWVVTPRVVNPGALIELQRPSPAKVPALTEVTVQMLGVAFVQVYPASTVQEEAQPSPLVVLPSSHVSEPSFLPFPHFWQTLGLAPLQVNPLSIAHVLEHPSPSSTLPSSHASVPENTTPSPQVETQEVSSPEAAGAEVPDGH